MSKAADNAHAMLCDGLLLTIKQSILGGERVDDFCDYTHALMADLPGCDAIGMENHRACGFVTCVTCEVRRRVRFGAYVIPRIRGANTAVLVHQRVYAAALSELPTHPEFNSAATRHVFSRLRGLVAIRIGAGFDITQGAWAFDRVAVTTAPVQIRRSAAERGITARGFDEFAMDTSRIDPRVFDAAGEFAGLITAAVTTPTSTSPLTIPFAESDMGIVGIGEGVLAAQSLWRAARVHLHLLRLGHTPKRARHDSKSVTRDTPSV